MDIKKDSYKLPYKHKVILRILGYDIVWIQEMTDFINFKTKNGECNFNYYSCTNYYDVNHCQICKEVYKYLYNKEYRNKQ